MQATQSPAFGLLLRRHRRAAGLTQEELAEQAGLSTRAIGDLERGIRQPRRDTLQMLLEALQLGADERLRLEVAAHALPTAPGSGIGAVQTGDFLGVAPPGPWLVGIRR